MNEQRNGDWIQTYTGLKMYPLDPRPEEIDIRDIVHALSNICRFNGHTTHFYSVAEHSCHVYDTMLRWPELDRRSLMRGLMHDAAEAYLCDIPRPLKLHEGWPQMYHDAEERIMRVIAAKFGFSWPMDSFTEQIDDAVLGTEFEQLMAHTELPNPYRPVEGLMLNCWEPAQARRELIRRFREVA